MTGCAVTAALARYEREQDIAEARQDAAAGVVDEHAQEVARRLMRLPGWIELSVDREAAANLALALEAALVGASGLAAERLLQAFKPAADEHARQLLDEAVERYATDPDPAPRLPDADSADLSAWQ